MSPTSSGGQNLWSTLPNILSANSLRRRAAGLQRVDNPDEIPGRQFPAIQFVFDALVQRPRASRTFIFPSWTIAIRSGASRANLSRGTSSVSGAALTFSAAS
jgi:hypothetical protein